ncbi:MAG: phosphoribosylformylglycinamidine synthase subunit PurS [Thermoplasmata archaeon]
MVKIGIEIEYLPGVEDPEAINIEKNLKVLGFKTVDRVTIKKFYEIEVSDSDRTPEKTAQKLAEKLLANKIIQKYNIRKVEQVR